MRKITIIAIIASIFTVNFGLNAQRKIEPNIAIGGIAGVTLSRTNFSPSIPQSFVPGLVGGVSFRYMEESHFGLIGQLVIEQRGWKETFENTSYKYERRLTYIQLPMMTHIFFGSKKFKGFFNLGPEISYMIADSKSSNFDTNNISTLKDFPSDHRTEQYKLPINSKFDYGIAAGVGMEMIAKKKNSIMIEGRFYYGLGNIFASHKTDYFSASPGMSIMISLGYMYRLK